MAKRSILITGCSSGIGLAAAMKLREEDWRVFASCKQQVDCDRLRTMGFEAPRIDYTDTGSIHQGLNEVLEATDGTLDALFNNGAHAIPGAVEDMPTDALRSIFEANFFGWHELTRSLLPIMRAQGHGRIIQCSSVLGLVTMPWRGAYNASKFALEGLTDTLRIEMRDTNIKIVLIEPGPITSKIRENAIPHFERWINWKDTARAPHYETNLLSRLYNSNGPDPFELPPEAVVQKLLQALESKRPRARYFVTTPTYVMAGLRRLLPTWALDWVLSRV
ncbi:SDR family NAD(P)-dependent oxidoreductase [Ascidiaceihabitans sp.]|jgi:NAD(P)-dependent dehydrogenase (short-subunit alcohol dehydrogenase family)|nr:SDR family NAD(P)-dependent oxidoreductase [Ascidiaceihabitans sp.]